MNRFLGFALPVVAIGLLFSCTSDIESAEDVLKKAESSSSATPAVPSSSSIGGGSSSSGAPLSGTSGTFADSRAGQTQTYKWVKIGSQIWMAENLNYNASGSECYNNLDSNCEIYGRLYNWETAKAACPSGWHLPSKAEWDVLGDDAKKLKATSFGGTNDYGFSALPGGHGYSDGSFYGVGDSGYWWSANEDGSLHAYIRGMNYILDDASWSIHDKSYLRSVRCVQD